MASEGECPAGSGFGREGRSERRAPQQPADPGVEQGQPPIEQRSARDVHDERLMREPLEHRAVEQCPPFRGVAAAG